MAFNPQSEIRNPLSKPLRLAHFSDVHLTLKKLGWRPRDLVGKKVTGWMNVRFLGRGNRFRHSENIIKLLRNEFAERQYDHLIFSGDATTLAFDREFSFAAEMLGVIDSEQTPCIAVPGNHDIYTRADNRKRLFDHHFGPWMHGQRIGDHTFPYARKAGHAWLIAVNSATANWWTFDASGAIGSEQLHRLKQLCQQLDPGPRILVTHYPLRSSRRRVETRTHRLRDHKAALATAVECGISLWLHGHIHKPYILAAGPDLPFPTICSGSCTQTRRWCYNDYALDGYNLKVTQRLYDLDAHRFQDSTQTELTLPLANYH